MVESWIDSLLFEVDVGLEEGAAQGVDGPLTELAERHLQEECDHTAGSASRATDSAAPAH